MSTVNFNFFAKICNYLLFFVFFMNSCLFSGNFVKAPGIFGEIFSIFLRNFWGIMEVSGANQGIFLVFWGIVWSFVDNFFGIWGESWNFCQEFEVSVIFFLEPGAKVGFFGGNLNFCDGFWYLFDVSQIVLGDFLNFWRYFFRCLGRKLEYWG